MPYYVEEMVFSRADTVVCLDFSRFVTMNRVIRRSFRQTFLRQQVGVHSPMSIRSLRESEHPIRWAWTTHAERRSQMRDWAERPELAHTKRVSLGSPREAEEWLSEIR
jgi:hypothetical protein